MLAASGRLDKYRLDKWGHQHMLRKITIGIAGPAAGALAAVGLCAVPAQAATTNVPCSGAALASAVGGAASGATLSLAPYCTYRLTAALPTVGQNLTILGNHATLQRSYAPATPAFTILSVDGSATLTVTSLNFINGAGAIAATQNASVTVQGGEFIGNQAANGGAINSTTGTGSLTVTDAVFSGNSATQAGGAIYTNEAAATTTVTGSTFTKNTADQVGGAIYNFFDMNVAGSTFAANQAEDGGAIFNNALNGDNLTDVIIRDNSATQNGGGVDTVQCTLSVTGGQIYGNHAENDGGGLYQDSPLTFPYGLTLTGTSVRGNNAQNGAGIYAEGSATTLSSGSTVSGNSATADGGGIYNGTTFPGFGDLTLKSSTISSNKAGTDGGGIYNTGQSVTATSSPVEFNFARSGGGGIYDGPGVGTVTLTTSPVRFNMPDNCEPTGTITGCTG
jgi:predicted outer membrane repeat protein